MPKANLPLGQYGMFVPAFDGSWLLTPAASWAAAAQPTTGLWSRANIAGAGTLVATLNITKFLQDLVKPVSVNTWLGESGGIGALVGFDFIYAIATAAATSITPAMFETQFVAGAVPSVKNAGNTPQFVLSPTTIANTVSSPVGAVFIQNVNLADYWEIGSNLEAEDVVQLSIVVPATTVITLYGATIFLAGQ